MSARAYLGQLLVCHTDAELGVLSNQRLSLREGGTDSSETDDDRSALPLMCTYLPIGELCHTSDLCLNSPHTPRLPSTPALLVPAPCCFCRAALCMWRQSQAPLSPVSTQSGLQGATPDLSLGRVWEYHLFSLTQPSLFQWKIILYIYEWSCLPAYTLPLF